jgi:hypothetical protein
LICRWWTPPPSPTEPPLGRRSSVGHPSTMGRLGGAGAALGGRVRVEHGREQRPDSPRKSPCLRPLDRPLRASDTAPPRGAFRTPSTPARTGRLPRVGARVAAYAHRQDADVVSPSPPSVAAGPQCSPPRPESRSPLGAALGMGRGPRGTPSSGPLRPPQRPHGARAQREPEVLAGEEMAEF